jgi:hypothetical protein
MEQLFRPWIRAGFTFGQRVIIEAFNLLERWGL